MSKENDKTDTDVMRGRCGKALTVIEPEIVKDWLENYESKNGVDNFTGWHRKRRGLKKE